MSNLNKILIIVLILQLALTAFIFWPKSTVQVGQPLLADFAAGGVIKLTIADNEDNVIVLAKSGDEWVLPEADDFPVQADKVSTLLEQLEGIKSNRLVTQTGASHNRLKVGESDFNRLIEIELAGGRPYKLFAGTSGGAGATHVRADGQPEVYLANINTFELNAQPSGWIDTLYVEIPQENVVALTLENENGTFEFTKEGDSWAMLDLAEGEIFNEGGLTGMLTNAATVRMTAPLGKQEESAYGLDEPLAVITLTYEDDGSSQTATIEVGAKTEDNSYYLKASESPYYVTVSEFTGNSFVEKTRDDFLQEPPAAESGEGMGSAVESE